jgi:antitoxin SocA-like protein
MVLSVRKAVGVVAVWANAAQVIALEKAARVIASWANEARARLPSTRALLPPPRGASGDYVALLLARANGSRDDLSSDAPPARETARATSGVDMPLKFAFNETKAVEVLAFIAQQHPGFTPPYVSDVLFFAEKRHLNEYGRPIIADTYIATPAGPVASTIRNYLDRNWQAASEPETFAEAVTIDASTSPPRLMPGARQPNTDLLSASDVACLNFAIALCQDKTPSELSRLTHFEKAWRAADPDRPMNYADFIDDDNEHRQEILELAKENSAYGIL